MRRRTALSLAGAGMAALAGCLGGSSTPGPTNDDDLPADDAPEDGYPPAFGETPEPEVVDPASFETVTRGDVEVPLAPIDVAYYWYARRDARFVDARGPPQYRRSHVYGAVLSPAPRGMESDPVAGWPTDDRIVCYCGCPHHLSSIRAANLVSKGYDEVYVIDEGFWEWHDRGYPMAGEEIDARPARRVIEGRTDARFAGRTAWARHPATGQREATAIDPDGAFALELRFSGVTDDSTVVVETPGYRVSGPLGDLTRGVVTG